MDEEKNFKEFLKKIESSGGRRLVKLFYTRAILSLIYDAWRFASERPKARILNLFASRDDSGFRESVYRGLFEGSELEEVDFWEDKFIYQGKALPNSHTLPFPDNTFDAVITTKVILEHVSEPELTIKEIHRVLKPGGETFIIAPFVTVVHQQPYDFFRYSEYGLRHLFNKAGLEVIYIKPTNSHLLTTADALGLIFKRLRKIFLGLAGFFDRFFPDRGRFTKYYICRVKKRDK